MIIKWSDELKIGVEEIDIEHKAIIDEFEKLYELMRKGTGHEYVKDLIAFLDRYVINHFEHEETLQEKYDYPEREKHIAYHKEFKTKVVHLKNRLDDSNIGDKDLIKINLMVKDWLMHHILEVDKKLGVYLTEKMK